jgi:ribonuclease HII
MASAKDQKRKKEYDYVIGVDEVGRGCFAGHVYVGACALPYARSGRKFFAHGPAPLRDSKQLSVLQREAWFSWMKREGIPYALGRQSPAVIDGKGIVHACNKAASQALARVLKGMPSDARILVVADGSLKPACPGNNIDFEAFPKADERVPAVSLASIAAKVSRDREMGRLHKRHPAYGLAENKGYGTLAHRTALKKHGPCALHRLTFIRNSHRLEKSD